MLFSTSIFDRFWSQLGPNLAPKIHPKTHPRAIKNRSQIVSYCWSVFWLIFHRFFIDFRPQNHSKIYQKSSLKSSQEHINKKLKTSILYCNLQYTRALGYVMLCTKFKKKWYRNPFKNSSQINTKLGSVLHPTWLHFGRFLEVKMEPNSLQDAFKMQSFFILFLTSFFIDFYPNLAPTWPPNPPQNPSKSRQKSIPNRIWFLICFLFFIDF